MEEQVVLESRLLTPSYSAIFALGCAWTALLRSSTAENDDTVVLLAGTLNEVAVGVVCGVIFGVGVGVVP